MASPSQNVEDDAEDAKAVEVKLTFGFTCPHSSLYQVKKTNNHPVDVVVKIPPLQLVHL